MIEDDPNACSVLLIDDEPFAETLIAHSLRACAGLGLHDDPDAGRAVELARRVTASVVLVDLRMPGVDGFEVIWRLRAHADTERIPVILLSSEEDAEIKARAFASGANDYLVKWPDPRELAARVRYHNDAFVARLQRERRGVVGVLDQADPAHRVQFARLARDVAGGEALAQAGRIAVAAALGQTWPWPSWSTWYTITRPKPVRVCAPRLSLACSTASCGDRHSRKPCGWMMGVGNRHINGKFMAATHANFACCVRPTRRAGASD